MMDRRTLLHLTGAALIAGCARSGSSQANPSVVVAGAGIVGASIAYHLSRQGAAVTVIDAAAPASQTTLGNFAWINASWAKQPRHYHALNQDGVAGWRSLSKALGIPLKGGGSIEWFDSEARQDRLAEQIEEQVAWGEPAEMIDRARMEALEPRVTFGDARRAAVSPNDAAIDPVLATWALLEAARKTGADLRYPCRLEGVVSNVDGIRAVETSTGSIPADRLVLATGATPGVAQAFAGTRLPQRSTPGVIAITRPMPPLLERLVIAPGVHLHQRLDGRVVLGEQDGAPETEAHAMRLADRPIVFPDAAHARQHFERIRRVAELYVPGMAKARMESVHIGWRPLPVDGHPVLGPTRSEPDSYIAIMHSGVSLAPVVGKLAATEIVSDTRIEALAPYRPDRTFDTVRRY
ncbi:MAG: FAD-binding oxidoreductase [Litorimonas sp.]